MMSQKLHFKRQSDKAAIIDPIIDPFSFNLTRPPAKEWSLSTAMAESPSPYFPPRYVLRQKVVGTLGGEKKTVQKRK